MSISVIYLPKRRNNSGSDDSSSVQRSVMFRALSGEIRDWDQSSEIAYGFSRSNAIGITSHRLLKTIFPEPLRLINARLLSDRQWCGELIHTRNNGEQVKVLSNWEVIDDSGELPIVRETNAFFTPLAPGTAQLKEAQLKQRSHIYNSSKNFILDEKVEFLKNLAVTSLIFALLLMSLIFLIWSYTHDSMLHPLR